MLDTSIIKSLASQAIERSTQKEELKSYCLQQAHKAFQLWDQGDYLNAISRINNALGILPKYPLLLLLKALIYCTDKQVGNSNKIIDLLKDQELTDLELNLKQYIQSCNCITHEKYPEAISYASEIINRNKRAYYAHLPRAISYQELNEHHKAIIDFKIASKEKLQVQGIKAGLAFSYMKRKKYIRAIILHLIVIRYFRENYRINYNIGLNLFLLKFYSKGLSYVNKSLELNPDFAEAYRSRGLILLTLEKDFEKAKELGAKGIEKTLRRFNLTQELRA